MVSERISNESRILTPLRWRMEKMAAKRAMIDIWMTLPTSGRVSSVRAHR